MAAGKFDNLLTCVFTQVTYPQTALKYSAKQTGNLKRIRKA
ncbi:hypothetical protein CEV32_0770 [Brucella rhizosphaerae]|uniref:Uncharacterized protein n=1 Tax=Brucella rhizosphaerae TaxID=571254 RepID=A0A256FCK7_9HYPH|nr:hypothetical protein CEV32_0770 [Brucella rhizosphaerae]